MKKFIFLLILLSLVLFSNSAFSQTEPLASCSYRVVVCKEDVCHLKVSFYLNNPNPYPVVFRVLYFFEDKDRKIVFSFWTNPINLSSHGSFSFQEDVLVDRERLDQVVRTFTHVVPCYGYGRRPYRFWRF